MKKTKLVKVKIGHLSGSPREFSVPSDTKVGDLVEQLGITLSGSDKIVNSNFDQVDTEDKVKSGEEYTISSNLKAK